MAEEEFVGPNPDELLEELPTLEIKRPHLKLEVGDIELDKAAREAMRRLSRDEHAWSSSVGASRRAPSGRAPPSKTQ